MKVGFAGKKLTVPKEKTSCRMYSLNLFLRGYFSFSRCDNVYTYQNVHLKVKVENNFLNTYSVSSSCFSPVLVRAKD